MFQIHKVDQFDSAYRLSLAFRAEQKKRDDARIKREEEKREAEKVMKKFKRKLTKKLIDEDRA